MQLGQAALVRAGDRGGGKSLTDSLPRAPQNSQSAGAKTATSSLTPGPAPPPRPLLLMPPGLDQELAPPLARPHPLTPPRPTSRPSQP